jgi:hypothetical protein
VVDETFFKQSSFDGLVVFWIIEEDDEKWVCEKLDISQQLLKERKIHPSSPCFNWKISKMIAEDVLVCYPSEFDASVSYCCCWWW